MNKTTEYKKLEFLKRIITGYDAKLEWELVPTLMESLKEFTKLDTKVINQLELSYTIKYLECDKTYSELSRELNVSRQYIKQCINNIIKRINKRYELYSYIVYGTGLEGLLND